MFEIPEINIKKILTNHILSFIIKIREGRMKEELKQKIKTEFAYHLYNFDSAIYGCKRPVDDKMKECFKKIIDFVEVVDKRGIEDFDLWVFVQLREGKMRSKKVRHVKLDPKSLTEALSEGFEISTDTTLVKIAIKPVFKQDYNVTVSTESVYENKFGLGKEENLTVAQVKRRYGLNEDENLFSVDDFKNSKIFKLYKVKDKMKEMVAGV